MNDSHLEKKLAPSDESSAANENDGSNAISESHVTNNEDHPQQLSKRMQRKLRKREQWLANLPAKRAKEREKMKQKRQAARLNNVCLPSRKKLKQSTMANSKCKIRVAIDLSFDDLMNPRDLAKCVKQLMRCYTLNRRTSNPLQLYFTSFNGKSEQEMSKNNGYSNWDIHFESREYIDVFPKEDIVYLSSESDNLITALDEQKVYIIGGLVDHNAHKGLCHQLAEEKKIAHGQLPISEFLELKSRKVLTIDHVFEILLGVSEGLSWGDSFLKVLPHRKGAVIKEEVSECMETFANKTTSECSSSNTEGTEELEMTTNKEGMNSSFDNNDANSKENCVTELKKPTENVCSNPSIN